MRMRNNQLVAVCSQQQQPDKTVVRQQKDNNELLISGLYIPYNYILYSSHYPLKLLFPRLSSLYIYISTKRKTE